MPYLTDPAVKQIYVNRVVNIYKNFSKLSKYLRKVQFENAIHAMFAQTRLPKPTILWGDSGGGFDHGNWLMKIENGAVLRNPHECGIRPWLTSATTPYHEAVHCEQAFFMLQALLTETIAIPTLDGSVLPRGHLAHRVNALHARGYRMRILEYAARTGKQFPQNLQFINRMAGWVDSQLGPGRVARKLTIDNAEEKGGKYRRPYLNLPEEEYAFAEERNVAEMVRRAIDVISSDTAYRGLRLMFRK